MLYVHKMRNDFYEFFINVSIVISTRQVSFLNQEALVDSIQKAVEVKLLNSNTTRTFYTQVCTLIMFGKFVQENYIDK